MQKELAEALEFIDGLCTPDKMSKGDAVEFLDTIIGELQSRIEALDEEIQNEEDDE